MECTHIYIKNYIGLSNYNVWVVTLNNWRSEFDSSCGVSDLVTLCVL